MTDSLVQKIEDSVDEKMRCGNCREVLTPTENAAFCEKCNSKLLPVSSAERKRLWKYWEEKKIAEKLRDLPTVHKESTGIYVDRSGVRYEKVETLTAKKASALQDKSKLFVCLNETRCYVILKKK